MSTNIQIIPNHRPPVEAGQYQISITQTLAGGTIPAGYGSETSTPLKTAGHFYVAGERFALAPKTIHSLYPPQAHSGEYANIFPHIILSRTTLPWERTAIPGDSNTPWLALIVVHQSEASQAVASTVALGQLKTATTASPYFPGLALEPGQANTDRVAVLDIKKSLLTRLLPKKADLNNLCHVRQATNAQGHVTDGEMAVVIANRLPQNNGTSTIYLVSLENRFTPNSRFKYQGSTQNDTIRLITLHTWQCFSEPTIGNFAGILKALNRTTATLRLPDTANPATNKFLSMGFYPVPHNMRQGTRTTSWYHGPLSPRTNTETANFPIKSADALLRFYKQYAIFDISYASAWALGRLLALQNNRFATALYRWKRAYAQALSKQQQTTAQGTGHLNGGNEDNSPPAMPRNVANWLTDLEQLKGIPFNYLVPDEQLLPAESIRFFQLDRLWLQSLQDGALSLGRVTTSDHQLDQTLHTREISLTHGLVSGFILRSRVVKGWPGMQINAYSGTPNARGRVTGPLQLITQHHPAENIMLCLFSGNLQTLDLHLKPQVLHFGVTPTDSGYKKILRNNNGAEINRPAFTINISNSLNNLGVLNTTTLVNDISAKYAANKAIKWSASPTSATLALQLIEGVQRVRFTAGPTTSP